MYYQASQLKGRTLFATDDEIGKVEDVYFDDERWGVRYLVVNAGGWLNGRRVLISPAVIQKGDWPEKGIPVSLTREQIRNSPPVDTDQPVSRHYEKAHADYFGYPYYWSGPHLWGIGGYASMLDAQPIPPDPEISGMRGAAEAEKKAAESSHLRSCKEVKGYVIQALDGSIGNIDDFFVDSETWAIAQLLVDTRKWLPGGQVLVSPDTVDHVDWNTSSVRLTLTMEQVRNSPKHAS